MSARRVAAVCALVVALGVARPHARADVACPPMPIVGAHVVPDACRTARALDLVTHAQDAETRVCALAFPQAAALCPEAAPPPDPAPPPDCSAGAMNTVRAWASAWSGAALTEWQAWDGHPIVAVELLAKEHDVRVAADAVLASCHALPRRPDPFVSTRDAYLAAARQVDDHDSLCAARATLLGDAWTTRGRGIFHSPVADLVARACGAGSGVQRPTPEQQRGRDVASAIEARLGALGEPLLVVARSAPDETTAATACGMLGPYVPRRGRDAVVRACSRRVPEFAWLTSATVLASVASVDACADDDLVCPLAVAVDRGPLSLAAWSSRHGLPALVRESAAAPDAQPTEAGREPYALTSMGPQRIARCRSLVAAAPTLLAIAPSALTIDDARRLLVLSRCQRAEVDADARAQSFRALHLVRDAAACSPRFAASPDHDGVAAVAALLLATTPGGLGDAHDLVRALALRPGLADSVAWAIAGGVRPDADARESAARIADGALSRIAEVAIDERRDADAIAALDLRDALVARGFAVGRDAVRTAVDGALLRAALDLSRGRRASAEGWVEDARAGLQRWPEGEPRDRILEEETASRAVEVGLVDPPRRLTDDACTRDLVRRGVIESLPEANDETEIRPLLAALRDDASRPLVTRGPCLTPRGYREMELRAALARVELVSRCFDAADGGGAARRACDRDADAAVRELGEALTASVAALGRWLDWLGRTGEVDRVRPALELAESLRGLAERQVSAERLDAWRARGVPAAHLVELERRVLALGACVAYPDLVVNLRFLENREVAACPAFRPLTPGATTLVYTRYEGERHEPRYAVWTVRDDSIARADLGPAVQVERRVAELVRVLDDPSSDPREAARDAYDTLVRPAMPAGASGDVVVVPDGAIAAVPLAALDDGHGVLAARDGLRLRSALSVGALREDTPISRGAAAIVVADPRFGESDGTSAIPRLRATHAEADALCSHFPCGGRRLEREAATESRLFSAVQERLGDYGVVHLATHAVFDRPGGAAVLLAGVGDAMPDDAAVGTRDDGLLTERELAALGLAATRLVVLSACGTQRGASRVGIRGLARAARVSGAAAVVGSLWSVDDAATGLMMAAFYDALGAGRPPSIALRDASAVVRARFPHPYYWAPFILFEAPR